MSVLFTTIATSATASAAITANAGPLGIYCDSGAGRTFVAFAITSGGPAFQRLRDGGVETAVISGGGGVGVITAVTPWLRIEVDAPALATRSYAVLTTRGSQ